MIKCEDCQQDAFPMANGRCLPCFNRWATAKNQSYEQGRRAANPPHPIEEGITRQK